jgi:hypothetical protein
VGSAESTLNYPGLQVSPPVHENQLSKSNKLDAEAIWLPCVSWGSKCGVCPTNTTPEQLRSFLENTFVEWLIDF